MQVVEKRIGWKDRGSKQCEETRYTCAVESKSQLEGRESEATRQCSLLMEDVITIHLNICIYTHQHTHPRIEKCLRSLYWIVKEHSTRRYIHQTELGFLTPRDETHPEVKFNAM